MAILFPRAFARKPTSSRSRHPSSPRAQSASFLLEAVLAAATAMTILALIAPMFARQIEVARRAKDVQQLDELVTKDINAYRQYARLWKQKSGSLSPDLINKDVSQLAAINKTAASNPTSVYNPNPSECAASGATFNPLVFSYSSDTGALTKVKGADDFLVKSMKIANYELKRSFKFSENGLGLAFLRIDYKAVPTTKNAPDLGFVRSAEIQIQAQNWC